MWLTIVRGGRVVATTRLSGTQIVLGRDPDCDVVLADSSISRRHAELSQVGGRWLVRDLASRNGVSVGGARISSGRAVGPGDLIQIGPFEVRLAEDTTSAPRPRPALVTFEGRHGPVCTLQDMAPPRIEARHLSTLLAFSGTLFATADPARRQRQLCELMLGPDFHGQVALLLRVRRDDPDAKPELLATPVTRGGAEIPHISRSLLRAVVARETAVFAVDRPTATEEAIAMSVPVKAMAALACPLGGATDSLDALYLTLPSACSTSEWLALTTMAVAHYRQSEQVWSMREAAESQRILQEELRRAREVQAQLVPPDAVIGPFDVAFGFAPCQAIGGDYVDAIPTLDGRLLLVAMDVTGKGLDAALIAACLHTSMHLGAAQGLSLEQLVRTLNQYIIATWGTMTAVTLAASILDPASGVVRSINCGHPTPLVVARDGAARELDACETMPLGFTEFAVDTRVDRLRPGDMLVFFSDGLSELFDERAVMLGVPGVTAMLTDLRRVPDAGGLRAPEQVARLHQRLAAYRGKASPSDDVSFILVCVGEAAAA